MAVGDADMIIMWLLKGLHLWGWITARFWSCTGWLSLPIWVCHPGSVKGQVSPSGGRQAEIIDEVVKSREWSMFVSSRFCRCCSRVSASATMFFSACIGSATCHWWAGLSGSWLLHKSLNVLKGIFYKETISALFVRTHGTPSSHQVDGKCASMNS